MKHIKGLMLVAFAGSGFVYASETSEVFGPKTKETKSALELFEERNTAMQKAVGARKEALEAQAAAKVEWDAAKEVRKATGKQIADLAAQLKELRTESAQQDVAVKACMAKHNKVVAQAQGADARRRRERRAARDHIKGANAAIRAANAAGHANAGIVGRYAPGSLGGFVPEEEINSDDYASTDDEASEQAAT